jgi:hypothetical protein
MSKYNSNYVEISKFEKQLLPVTYSLMYNFKGKKRKKGSSYYGIDVLAYNTTTFYPSGHCKPLSKIINLTVFNENV